MSRPRPIVFALVLACSFAAIAQDKPKETTPEAVVRLTNEWRSANKVAPLAVNDKLTRAAQGHADNMARQDKYGDEGKGGHILDGKNPKDRIEEAGYKFSTFGENVHCIVRSADPAKQAVEGWKKSEGHNKNMLSEKFTQLGVGAARSNSGKWYFVQVFGSPR